MIYIEKEDRHKIISETLKKISFYRKRNKVEYLLIHLPIFRVASINRTISIFLEIIRIFWQVYLIIFYKTKSKNNLIILREFNSFIILFLIFFPKRLKSNLILFINHNITTSKPFIKKLLFNNKFTGLKFLLFDGKKVRKLFSNPKDIYTPLFPANINKYNIRETIKLLKSKLKRKYSVGISLSLNKKSHSKVSRDKLFLISKLIERKISIKIFSRDSNSIIKSLPKSKYIEIKDTSSKEKYIKSISETTIFVIYESKIEKTYKYRHSGSIMELINYGCIPIVPDLPLLHSQVKSPYEVGFVYDSNSNIELIINNIIEKINTIENNQKDLINNFKEYLDQRSKQKIVKL